MEASSKVKYRTITRRGLFGWLGAGAVAILMAPPASPGETKKGKSATPPTDEGLLPTVDKATKLKYVVDIPTEPKAYVKLAPLEGRFVKLIELSFQRQSGRVQMRFLFLGPEDPKRVIRVSLELIDSKGKSIRVLTQDAFDVRPGLQDGPQDVTGGEVSYMFLPTNEQAFQFEETELKAAKQAIIIMEELLTRQPSKGRMEPSSKQRGR